ncbi:hypothetical protein M413DRAFT_124969 [Hebeloma cylindrosporum]|uniref:HNH nuclease domain-containing protein n=1 Tax=Hebeloma cylindrosporum TaxID=76867 RepID=A0A0C2YP93_HEBCY|nr:hypothetical protein M413DRAFT_124969 [Hebeloma cylindrosporum h7]
MMHRFGVMFRMVACLAQPREVYLLPQFISERPHRSILTSMSDLQVPLKLLPLQPHEFHSLPPGFEYHHEISEVSNTTAFETAVDERDFETCVLCGREAEEGLHPCVSRAHVIGETEGLLWERLKRTGFVPSSAKSVVHEPRNGISLCDNHRSDFDGYRFFIRWVPSLRAFVFVNFARKSYLDRFHGKKVVLDPDHRRCPFPAPFLIHEMRTRGFHPWCADRPIPHPQSATYARDDNDGVSGMADFGGGRDTGVGFGGNDGVATSPTSEPPSPTAPNQEYLVLGNPFQDQELLESMRRQWQQLPNWRAATVEGLTWEGTAGENARKYVDLVGVQPADVS